MILNEKAVLFFHTILSLSKTFSFFFGASPQAAPFNSEFRIPNSELPDASHQAFGHMMASLAGSVTQRCSGRKYGVM